RAAGRDGADQLLPRISALRTAETQLALRARNIAVEFGEPVPPVGLNIEVANRAFDLCRYVAPEKLRIEVDEVSRRRVTEPLVHPDLFKLVVKRIGLAQIVRIAELADEIGGADQDAVFAGIDLWPEPPRLDSVGDSGGA